MPRHPFAYHPFTMIPARSQKWAHVLFRFYLRRLFRKSFRAFHLLGDPPVLPGDTPVVLVPNHNTWWDGFFVYMINRWVLHKRLYLMMLAEQLRRFPFFRRVGAFGIEPGSRRSVIDTLAYSSAQLRDPGSLVCLFPQGVLRPYAAPRLPFRPGLRRIIEGCGREVAVVLLGMKVELLIDQEPEVFFRFDEPKIMDGPGFPGIERLQEAEFALLDRLDASVAAGERGTTLFSGKEGLHER